MSDKQLIEYICTRMDRLEDKIDKLNNFKWQVVGGALVMSGVLTLGFQLVTIFTKVGG